MMFAAGLGTRMRPLTLERPKPMIEVAGRSLIRRTLDLARAIEPAPIVVNLHHKAEMLRAHLSDTGVSTVTEWPEILDTGGGLKNALPLLGTGPVMTSNTDAIWIGPNPFERLLAAWDSERMDALLVCVPLGKCIGRSGGGDFDLDADARLTRGNGYVYGGVQMLKTDLVAAETEPAFSLNRVWNALGAKGRLFGLHYPGRWCDIGTPEGIGLAEAALAQAADGS